MFRFKWIAAHVYCCCVFSVVCCAQETTLAEALNNLHARAGVVFCGQVVKVQPRGGVVDVEFRVDAALKGTPGAAYVLHEWGGLWAAGQRRYWVGERAMVFLRAPNASGLSSAVDGMDGVLPATANAAGLWAFEVSRLRTRLLRPVGEPMAGDAKPMTLAEVRQSVSTQAMVPGESVQRSEGPR